MGVTWEFIEAYPNDPWMLSYDSSLSYDRSITTEVVLANLDTRWNWYYLSRFLTVTSDNIDAYPWDWGGLSSNGSLTLELVVSRLGKPWNWERLSRNPRMLVWKKEEARLLVT